MLSFKAITLTAGLHADARARIAQPEVRGYSKRPSGSREGAWLRPIAGRANWRPDVIRLFDSAADAFPTARSRIGLGGRGFESAGSRMRTAIDRENGLAAAGTGPPAAERARGRRTTTMLT